MRFFCLLALCALAPFASAGTADRLIFHRAHSHNDYQRKHPLADALESRFYSVEADLWISGGEVRVAHFPWGYVGTLRELYLEPLRKRIEGRGSVHGDGKTFSLWLDLKEGGTEFRMALAQLLARYQHLMKPTKPGTEPPLTVILTGSEEGKSRFLAENPSRGLAVVRDQTFFREEDPPGEREGWAWYALRWPFRWDGKGAMPDDERARLKALVGAIHAKGRKLRFFGAPDTPGFWSIALEDQIDLIGTDQVENLSGFLRSL